MSKKYKDAMDKIIASDELKSRVLTAAAEKIADSEKSHAKRVRQIYIRRAIGYAACFAICITSVMLYKNFRTDNSPVPPIPAHTQVPVTPDPTAAAAVPKKENPSSSVTAKDNAETPAKTTAPTAVPMKPQSVTPEQTEQPAATSAPVTGSNSDITDVPVTTPNVNDSLETGAPSDGLCGGNPFAEAAGLDELYADAGYAFKMPYSIPGGYRLSGCALIGGTLVQITYKNDTDTILYRTEKSAQDISGDYNSYPDIITIDINGVTAAARGFSGKYYSAIWQDGESSYALGSSGGLSEEDIKKIIESIDFYKQDE